MKQEKKMTRQEAQEEMQTTLVRLAQTAVSNKRLTDYIEYLDNYITQLDQEEQEKQAIKEEKNEQEAK